MSRSPGRFRRRRSRRGRRPGSGTSISHETTPATTAPLPIDESISTGAGGGGGVGAGGVCSLAVAAIAASRADWVSGAAAWNVAGDVPRTPAWVTARICGAAQLACPACGVRRGREGGCKRSGRDEHGGRNAGSADSKRHAHFVLSERARRCLSRYFPRSSGFGGSCRQPRVPGRAPLCVWAPLHPHRRSSGRVRDRPTRGFAARGSPVPRKQRPRRVLSLPTQEADASTPAHADILPAVTERNRNRGGG